MVTDHRSGSVQVTENTVDLEIYRFKAMDEYLLLLDCF